jgi:hypothetical protein
VSHASSDKKLQELIEFVDSPGTTWNYPPSSEQRLEPQRLRETPKSAMELCGSVRVGQELRGNSGPETRLLMYH